MTTSSPERSDLLARLDVVERRLEQHARTPAPTGLTEAEPGTGERWEVGQVWAHLAEFPAYWLGQVRAVLEARERGEPEPVPFGRTKTDPDRIAAIERDRSVNVPALLGRLREGIAGARHLIGSLPEQGWSARGLHPVRGEMTIGRIVEQFLVDHLEEHAAQLDSLSVA